MTTTAILTILFGVLSVITIILSYYFSIKTKIQEAAGNAINAAEQLNAIGIEKLEVATGQVYALVPTALKPFLTKELVRQIVQFTFDRMKEFAIEQENKNKEK